MSQSLSGAVLRLYQKESHPLLFFEIFKTIFGTFSGIAEKRQQTDTTYFFITLPLGTKVLYQVK